MRSVPSRKLLLWFASALVAVVVPLHAQKQAPKEQSQATFKVRVEYVEVDAVVRDKQGNFVADLKENEFEVFEDGKRQEIANLAVVDVPVEPRPAVAVVTNRAIEPDIVTNDAPSGRVYLIVLDDLHVASQRSPAARKLARQFIEQNMAANDVAAVVYTHGSRANSQDFTASKRLLLAAVDKFVGRKMASPGAAAISNNLTSEDPNAVNATGNPLAAPTATIPDPAARERIFNARQSLQTLGQLATFLGTIHNRRKAMVMIGEGIDYDLGQAVGTATAPNVNNDNATLKPAVGLLDQGVASRAVRDDYREFVDAANRANVTLYAVDPRVYTQGGDDMVDVASGVARDTANGYEVTNLGTLLDDIQTAQNNLRDMAGQTGGFAVTGSLKNVSEGYERIRAENSHYYILGYYPASGKNDGKFHRIEVRVKRPGTIVVARKGYVSPKDKKPTPAVETKEGTSAPLKEALGSALPIAGLPIAVTAAAFRGGREAHSVLVMLQTPPGGVNFVEKDGRYVGDLEVSFVAMDFANKTRGGEHLNLTMPLRPETHTVVNRTGLLVQSRVNLPPGRYVLRVGARDLNADKVGAVHCDVEVPDFEKLPLSMSGIVLASREAMAANPRPDGDLKKIFGDDTPAVIRDFRDSDVLTVLAEIYDTRLQTPHDVDMKVTVVGEDGREAYRHDEKHSTNEIKDSNGGFGYLLHLPLAGMGAGSYVLRVEAQSRLNPDKPVSRDTVFRVVTR